MKRTLLVATAFACFAGTAHANPVQLGPLNGAAAFYVDVQFIYSKAAFEDSLVLNASTNVSVKAGLPGSSSPGASCFETTNGTTPISNCIFDEGECYNPPALAGASTICPENATTSDHTCACNAQTQFVHVATVTGDNAVLDFHLLVDTQPDQTVDIDLPSQTVGADGFDHLKATKMGDGLFLLQWEDGINGGDQDFNDFVAVVRATPADCDSLTNPAVKASCLSAGYWGTDMRAIQHVKADDPKGAGASTTTSGLSIITSFINTSSTTPHTLAACQTLTVAMGNNAENRNVFNFPTTTSGDVACLTDGGGQPATMMFSLGAAGGNWDFTSAGGFTDCNGASPQFGGANFNYNHSEYFTVSPLQGTGTIPPQAEYYPGNSPSNKVIYALDFDTHQTDVTDKIWNGATAQYSEADIRSHIYAVAVNGLPLVTHLYNDDTSAMPANFNCPTGANGELDGTIYAPQVIQGVPGSVAINSPVDVTIQTVPPGHERTTDAPETSFLIYTYFDNLPQLVPGSSSLSGIISTTIDTPSGPQPLLVNERFGAGGSGIRKVHTHIAFPNGLPDGFKANLLAVLVDASTQANLVYSNIPLSHDHSPPTVSAASTVRSASGVKVDATVGDEASGVGQVKLLEGVNATSVSSTVMDYVSGNFYDPTAWTANLSGFSQTDVVSVDLQADDTHFNLSTAVRLPVANTGGDRQVECQSQAGANVTLDGSGSTAATNTTVSYLWSGPFGAASGVTVLEPLAFGPNTVTLSLADGRGFTGTETSTVTVGDSTPPALSVSVNPTCLWPPNHKGVSFQLGSQLSFTVHDTCDPNPFVRIVGVTASDGSAVSFDGSHVCIGATKDVTYTVTVAATDAHGNTSTATATVTIPHDNAHSSGCGDPNTMPGC